MRLFNFRLSYACLAAMLLGATMDLATTEVLLARGYPELNPLFYALGHQGFLAVYLGILGFALVTLWVIDSLLKLYPRIGKRRGRAILIGATLAYAGIHLYLGFGQLYFILGGH